MHKQGKRDAESLKLRKSGGLFLKRLREDSGLTQRELAEKLKINYYTMISQMESGATRVPPNQYAAYAKALGHEPALFVKKLLEYYDPHTYRALYGATKVSLAEFIK